MDVFKRYLLKTCVSMFVKCSLNLKLFSIAKTYSNWTKSVKFALSNFPYSRTSDFSLKDDVRLLDYYIFESSILYACGF